MHHTIRSARPAAALALAVAATLVTPGLASASTTTPTTGSAATTAAPATTTAPTTTGPTTTSSTGSATTSAPSTTAPAATTGTTAPPTTGATTSTSTGTATAPSTTTAPSSSTTTTTGGLVRGGDAARYGLAAPSALPATSTDPALVGAGFLERQLAAGGHHFFVTFDGIDYPDYGVTLDAVLALDAAGAGQTEAAAATEYVADNVMDYISSTQFDPTGLYAGATAKSLLVAVAQGVDPKAFGGVDLVSTLKGLEQPNGRFADKSDFGDNSNLIGQSFAVMALRRAGQTTSPASVEIIRDNQCSDGGFSLGFGAEPCVSDPDVTAFAVQALLAARGAGDADAGEGLDYLAGIQGADGGVGGAGPTAAHNANSTGLAGQAFLAGGRTAQARAAQGYLRALQYGCTYPAGFRGGIAYDRAAFTAAAAPGAVVQDQDRRATSQALLALAGTPLYAVSGTGADATAPDLTCAAAPTTTTSTTTSPTSTTSTTASGTSSATSSSSTDAGSGSATAGSGGSGAGGAVDPASATPGSLAFTGADISAFVIAGLLLLVLGAGALVLARRKGVHA